MEGNYKLCNTFVTLISGNWNHCWSADSSGAMWPLLLSLITQQRANIVMYELNWYKMTRCKLLYQMLLFPKPCKMTCWFDISSWGTSNIEVNSHKTIVFLLRCDGWHFYNGHLIWCISSSDKSQWLGCFVGNVGTRLWRGKLMCVIKSWYFLYCCVDLYLNTP